MKDYQSYNTSFCGPMGDFKSQVSLYIYKYAYLLTLSMKNFNRCFKVSAILNEISWSVCLTCVHISGLSVTAAQALRNQQSPRSPWTISSLLMPSTNNWGWTIRSWNTQLSHKLSVFLHINDEVGRILI